MVRNVKLVSNIQRSRTHFWHFVTSQQCPSHRLFFRLQTKNGSRDKVLVVIGVTCVALILFAVFCYVVGALVPVLSILFKTRVCDRPPDLAATTAPPVGQSRSCNELTGDDLVFINFPET